MYSRKRLLYSLKDASKVASMWELQYMSVRTFFEYPLPFIRFRTLFALFGTPSPSSERTYFLNDPSCHEFPSLSYLMSQSFLILCTRARGENTGGCGDVTPPSR